MVRSVLVIITLVDQQLDGFHLNIGGRFKRLFNFSQIIIIT